MARNSSPVLSSVIKILREVFKLTLKNKNIFLLITLSTLILRSLFFIFSTSSMYKNVMAEWFSLFKMDPKSPEHLNRLFKTNEEAIISIVMVIIFHLFMSAISLCSVVATIYASAVSYLGKDLSLMDIFLKLKKIWLRPVITWFCFLLLTGAYFLIIIVVASIIILVAVLVKESIIIVLVAVVVAAVMAVVMILAVAFPVYLYLVWMLGLVSSVLEDCCGLEALRRGQKLVKGRKAVGSVIFLFWLILINPIMYLAYVVNENQYQTVSKLMVTSVAVVFQILVSMATSMAYTVFYFVCKKGNGEEVQIHEVDMGEYTRVSAAIPIVGKDFP